MRKPTLTPFGPRIDGIADARNSSPLISTDLYDLALELAVNWGLSENDMDIYFPPDQASTQPSVMIVAAVNPTKERVVGVCQVVEGDQPVEGGDITFGGSAQRYLRLFEHKNPMDIDISRVQIKLLEVTQLPKHGRLEITKNNPYHTAVYYPDAGYYGKDRVEATVAVGKDVVRVVYNFVVQRKAVDNLQNAEHRKFCPKGFVWKISGASEEVGTIAGAGEKGATH